MDCTAFDLTTRCWHALCSAPPFMSEQAELLKERTMRLALDVCKLLKLLPWDEPGRTGKRQLARAATGTAFNYRAACRGRSHDEFAEKKSASSPKRPMRATDGSNSSRKLR